VYLPIPILVFGHSGLLPKAFSLGCADFLTEPWDYPELKARALRSVPPPILCVRGRCYCLREKGLILMQDSGSDFCRETPESSHAGGSAGIPAGLPAELPAGVPEELKLSYYESAILRLLLINRAKPVYREAIQYALWGELNRSSRALDMHITSLRKKIKRLYAEDEPREERICAVRNVGYRFT
jgi:DNA-binding response OmpR family regulator